MRKKRKDAFVKVMKAAAPDTCVPDMADLVMQHINAVEQEEVTVSASLKQLLVKHGVDCAPLDITRNVMGQIAPLENQTSFRPIISNRAMRIAAFAIATPLLILCFFAKTEQSTVTGNFAHILTTRINALPTLCVSIFILMGILLTIDFLLTKKLKGNSTDSANLA